MELVKISEFRKKFDAAIHDYLAKSLVDKRDVTRIKLSDKYVCCFITWKKDNVDDAVKLAVDVLKWRKSMNINDIRADNLDHSLLQRGITFSHGKAIDNTRIVYFLVRLQTKSIKAEVQRILSLLLENIQRQETGKHVTFLLDVSKATMNNVDLGAIKFLLDCFTTYFPDMLAIWKIVKQWMTEDQRRKTVFCSFKDLKQYIAPENILKYMGGEDEWTYSFPSSFDVSPCLRQEDELSYTSSTTSGQQEIDASEMCTAYGEDDELELAPGNNALTMVEATMESPQINQKKHNLNTGDRYAELCAVGTRKVNQVKSHPEEPVNAVTRCNTGRSEACRKVESNHHSVCNFPNGINLNSLLILSPATEVVFRDENFESTNGKYHSQFTLTNLNRETQVAFKIKTNSPNHYLVKPSIGYVSPGSTISVFLYLNPGFENKLADDKFLILYQRKGDATSLREFWRTHIPKHMRHEYRLYVRFISSIKSNKDQEERAKSNEEMSAKTIAQDQFSDIFSDAQYSPSIEMELGRVTKEVLDLKSAYLSTEGKLSRLRCKLQFSLILHGFVIFLLCYVVLKLSVLTSLLELGHSWK